MSGSETSDIGRIYQQILASKGMQPTADNMRQIGLYLQREPGVANGQESIMQPNLTVQQMEGPPPNVAQANVHSGGGSPMPMPVPPIPPSGGGQPQGAGAPGGGGGGMPGAGDIASAALAGGALAGGYYLGGRGPSAVAGQPPEPLQMFPMGGGPGTGGGGAPSGSFLPPPQGMLGGPMAPQGSALPRLPGPDGGPLSLGHDPATVPIGNPLAEKIEMERNPLLQGRATQGLLNGPAPTEATPWHGEGPQPAPWRGEGDPQGQKSVADKIERPGTPSNYPGAKGFKGDSADIPTVRVKPKARLRG